MATKAATKRLTREHQLMQQDPPPYCFARPLESDVLTWHFILRGPPDTPYAGGEYWGQLLFPADYPFKPPGIKMTTPSGRFKENEKICTSMSDFHPGSWQPCWSVANILIGLHSFMNSDEITTGGMSATRQARQTWAARSHAWNVAQPRFAKIFPEYSVDKENATPLPNMGETRRPTTTNDKNTSKAAPASASAAAQATADQPPKQHDPIPPQTRASNATASNGSMPAQNDTSPATAASAAARPPQAKAPLFSTRSKVALCFGIVAWLFVSRLMSRSQSVPS